MKMKKLNEDQKIRSFKIISGKKKDRKGKQKYKRGKRK